MYVNTCKFLIYIWVSIYIDGHSVSLMQSGLWPTECTHKPDTHHHPGVHTGTTVTTSPFQDVMHVSKLAH